MAFQPAPMNLAHHGAPAPEAVSVGRRDALRRAARVTAAGDWCAWIDAGNRLNPFEAAAEGVLLRQLLWVRCTPAGQAVPAVQAWQAAQLLLRTASFALIVLDAAHEQPRPFFLPRGRQHRAARDDKEVLLLFRAQRETFPERPAGSAAFPVQAPAAPVGKLLSWPRSMRPCGT